MVQLLKTSLLLAVLGTFFIACEEEAPADVLPLEGVYTLTEMIVNVVATTLNDTTLRFISPQAGLDSILLAAGTPIENSSMLYTDQDADPIGGTVTLNNDESANLTGYLPYNLGTGCLPNVTITALTSDGSWSADTSLGTFSIDLVVDALDIDGTYNLVGDQLEIRYEMVTDVDERFLTTITYLNEETAVSPSCLPVSVVTERIMKLTLN